MKRRLYDNASIKLPSNNPADAPDPIEYTLQNVKDGDVWIKFNNKTDSIDQLNELLGYLFPDAAYAMGDSKYYTGDTRYNDWKSSDKYIDHSDSFSYFYSLYLETANNPA